MSSLCSLSTSSNSTSHLWGIIMFSPCIIQLYLSFSKIQPSSGLTFNSLSGFPSAAVSRPRCWKPASCSAGFQDLNQNFWHSVHIAHCGSLLFWPRVSLRLQRAVLFRGEHCSVVLKVLHYFPNDFCFALHVSSISISECGLKRVFRTPTNSDYSGERRITSLDCCFLLLRQICTSLLAFLCRPCLCKKSNFFVISAIKMILIPDENVVLQFSFNILKQYFYFFLCLFLLLAGGPLEWIIISSKIGCAISHG